MAKIVGGFVFIHGKGRASGILRVEVKGEVVEINMRGKWDAEGVEVATESGTVLKLDRTGWGGDAPRLRGPATPKSGEVVPMVAFLGYSEKTGKPRYGLKVDDRSDSEPVEFLEPF